MPNEHTVFLCKKAKQRRIKCRILKSDSRFCVLSKNKKEVLVSGGVLADDSSASAFVLAESKVATNEYLKMHGYAVLPQQMVIEYSEAKRFLLKYKKIVLKPINQKQGRGITVNISSEKELKQAWKIVEKYGHKKVVEKYYKGRDFRLLVINYKDVFMIERQPANVVGDGRNTILTLINQKNKLKANPLQRRKTIKIDNALRFFLSKNGLKLSSVPTPGEIVVVRGTANLHTGGETIERTDEIGRELKREVLKIAKLLKMSVVGIDYLARDINKKRFIIELNADPGVQMHHFPIKGKPQLPIESFLNMLFKDNQ